MVDPLGITQAVEGVGPALLAFRSLFSKRRDDADALPHPEALGVYRQYQGATLDLVIALRLLADIGVPPKAAGGIYTWPAVLRIHRLILTATEQALVSFGEIVMLGSYAAGKAGLGVMEAIARATKEFQPAGKTFKIGRREFQPIARISLTPGLDERIQESVVAIRNFALTVRDELGVSALALPQTEK